MDDGNIISHVDYRFIKFNPFGKPIDVIEFDKNLIKFKGEKDYKDYDRIYYLVYWHQYFCSNDEGINRQIFIPDQDDL